MNALDTLALFETYGRRWDTATAADWAEVIATFPLFAGVRKRRLRKLVRGATFAEFAPGETMIYAGEPGARLYVILAGHAKATSTRTSQLYRTGEYFGEVAMIDGRPSSVSVFAMSHVHVMMLPSQSVLDLARQYPAITIRMLKYLTMRFRHLEIQVMRAAPESSRK
jgi:CRP-like cAMP-binding protein